MGHLAYGFLLAAQFRVQKTLNCLNKCAITSNIKTPTQEKMTADFYLFVEFCAVSGGLTDISEKKLYSLYLSNREKNRDEHHWGGNKRNHTVGTLWYESY